MSKELLRIDKLATLEEIQFILLDVLDRSPRIDWFDLSSTCKAHSYNLIGSFECTIQFLQLMSIIEVDDDRIVARRRSINYQELTSNYTLCTWLTERLIQQLGQNGLLSVVLKIEMIKYDIDHDSYSLNTTLIPFDYPLIKLYLLNMGIARADSNLRNHIIINSIYKKFFKGMITPIFNSTKKLDIHSSGASDQHPKRGLKVFISYSHKDEAIKDELYKHLSGLRRNNKIDDWNDRMIRPGEEWDAAIKKALEEADIIIFLISADLIASEYVNKVEIARALQRHDASLTKLIPVLARPCDFPNSSLSHLQALPKDAKPITSWGSQDEAYLNIVNELKKIIGD